MLFSKSFGSVLQTLFFNKRPNVLLILNHSFFHTLYLWTTFSVTEYVMFYKFHIHTHSQLSITRNVDRLISPGKWKIPVNIKGTYQNSCNKPGKRVIIIYCFSTHAFYRSSITLVLHINNSTVSLERVRIKIQLPIRK